MRSGSWACRAHTLSQHHQTKFRDTCKATPTHKHQHLSISSRPHAANDNPPRAQCKPQTPLISPYLRTQDAACNRRTAITKPQKPHSTSNAAEKWCQRLTTPAPHGKLRAGLARKDLISGRSSSYQSCRLPTHHPTCIAGFITALPRSFGPLSLCP